MYNPLDSPVPAAIDPVTETNPVSRREDLAYQAMTIGAIVTVLISVWVF